MDFSKIFPHVEYTKKNGIANYIGDMHKRIGPVASNYRNSNLLVADAWSVYRGSPFLEIHDALGYKNKKIPSTADIVVLGNSMVHDLNSVYDETWPALLGECGFGGVYSASMGGQSIVQYLLSLSETLFLNPKKVVLNYYFGNNVFNSTSTLRVLKNHEFVRLFNVDLTKIPRQEKSILVDEKNEYIKGLGRLPRAELLKKCEVANIPDCVPVKINNQKFFNTPNDTINRMNIDSDFNMLGFNISERSIEIFAAMADEYKFDPIFLSVPSREKMVYQRSVECGDIDFAVDIDVHKKIFNDESILMARLEKICEKVGVKFESFDSTIFSALPNGYFKNNTDDFHPSAYGKKMMADFVAKVLKN